MAPLEPWARVFVKESFLETVHGKIECASCHKGNEDEFDNKTKAHNGLVAYPSEEAETYCGSCHAEQVESFKNSLHKTQEGYYKRFEIRAGYDIRDAGHEEEYEAFKMDCGKCHASCGQCHISRPRSVKGGFISGMGHEFKKTPDQTENCTACHGSRVGDEYTGVNEKTDPDIEPDYHYYSLAKRCGFCHTGDEMHGGDGTLLTYRFDEHNSAAPKCENCHDDSETKNTYHSEHWSGESGVTLSCQVCHSQSYKNCNGCHAGEGITGTSYLSFEIGRNYLKDNERYQDYDYITVRHIPIATDTYEEFGVSDLNYFETTEPTWKMTIPHNIQRWTPQTEKTEGQSCNSACHNSDYYLTADDIEYYKDANGGAGYGFDDITKELNANKDVIIIE